MFYSLHALTSQNVGRNATSASPYIKTFSNCYSVDKSVSFEERQHHSKFHLTWARGTQFGEGLVLAVHLSESVSPFARNFRPWQHLFHRSGLKHYSTIRLLTLCVKFDGISPIIPELEHLPWTGFIRCIWNILCSIKAPFAKTNAPFLIFAFFVCFLPQNQFQCISQHAENTNRVIFSSHHVEMAHLNCKTVGQRDFSRFLELCL